jgi:hypothetical protein
MATVSIIQRPIETINASPLIKSRWTAGWNPVFYSFSFTGITDLTTYLIVSVYEYGSNTLLGKDTYRPRNGRLNIDISSIVRSYLFSTYSPSLSVVFNSSDNGGSIRCYLKYQLNTLTEAGAEVSDEANYIYVANAAKQVGEEHGQNMAEYVPYGVDGIMKAKFLTKFDEPVFFTDYPFTISFIYSENIIGHELKLLENRLDINGAFLTDEETELFRESGHYINHLRLQTSYPDNVKYVDISIATGDAALELYVYEGYVETGYTEAR